MEKNAVLDLSHRKSTVIDLTTEDKSNNNDEKPRRKRIQQIRPAEEKLIAVERVLNGETKAAVARAMGIPESTIRGWVKVADQLRETVASKKAKSSAADLNKSCEVIEALNSDDDNPLVIDTSESEEECCERSPKRARLEPPPSPIQEMLELDYEIETSDPEAALDLRSDETRRKREEEFAIWMENNKSAVMNFYQFMAMNCMRNPE